MSYSRWSNSVWYTFWCSTSSNKRDEQIFQICDLTHSVNLTYAEIKKYYDNDDLDTLKQNVKEEIVLAMATTPIKLSMPSSNGHQAMQKDDDVNISHPPMTLEKAFSVYTDEEYDELIGYMVEFVKDVEQDEKLDD